MPKSLQDQLRQAGLVNKKKASKAEKALRAKDAQIRKGKAVDETNAAAKAAMAEKQAKDRELNKARDAEAQARAIAAQVRQLITMNRLPKDGDIAYNFVDGKKVKRIHVSQAQQDGLVRGQLGIASLDDGYEVLPRRALEKIRERDAAAVVVCNEPSQDQDDEDDPYKDFKVPDDLMW